MPFLKSVMGAKYFVSNLLLLWVVNLGRKDQKALGLSSLRIWFCDLHFLVVDNPKKRVKFGEG